MKLTLPVDSNERKEYSLSRGCYAYFPAALAGVARQSFKAGAKHTKGELIHIRDLSVDHEDCIERHLMDLRDIEAAIERAVAYSGAGPEGVKALEALLLAEANALAWRALALSQVLHEKYGGAPLAPAARLPEEPVVKTDGVQTCMEQGPGQQGYCSRQKGHTGPHAAHQGHALHLVPYLYWGGNYHLTLQIHFGDAKDWHGTCDAADCWCLGTKHHTVKD